MPNLVSVSTGSCTAQEAGMSALSCQPQPHSAPCLSTHHCSHFQILALPSAGLLKPQPGGSGCPRLSAQDLSSIQAHAFNRINVASCNVCNHGQGEGAGEGGSPAAGSLPLLQQQQQQLTMQVSRSWVRSTAVQLEERCTD